MMHLLDRYIVRTLIFFTVLVAVAFLGVTFFIALVKESSVVGQGQYGLLQALIYVGSQLPGDFYAFFPVIALLGSLMGLGDLASHNELIVMRVSGVSLNRLLFSVMIGGWFLIVVAGLIGEGLGPPFASWGAGYKLTAVSGGVRGEASTAENGRAVMREQGAQSSAGVWIRDKRFSKQHFIHIGHVIDPTHLEAVTEYIFNTQDPQQLEQVSYAERASIEGDQWILYNVQQSDIGLQTISAKQFIRRVSPLRFDPHLLMSAGDSPAQYTLAGLYGYIAAHQISSQAQPSIQPELAWYHFIFWKRIFQPLLTLIVILLAIPCMVGPLRSVSMGLRLLIGIVLGLALHMTNALLGSLSSLVGLSPILAAGLPVGMFLLVSMRLIWRWR